MNEPEPEWVNNNLGHKWRRNEFGDIDMFGVEYEHHNGPICEVCDYGFCMHCQPLPTVECDAIEGEFKVSGSNVLV